MQDLFTKANYATENIFIEDTTNVVDFIVDIVIFKEWQIK